MPTKNFRKDINGLRALAVLSVVAFHFSDSLAPGGFVGVDVFFVISGFLMTSIIMKGMDAGDFSIAQFLTSRAKRIIPALTFVILLMLIIGYLSFDPITFKKLGTHSLGSLLFFSNIIYQNESGYFDGDSISKVLLHTWSLSVEWQFYVLYPILISLIARFTSKKIIKKTIPILFLFSFFWCIYLTYNNPIAAYYSIASRAWEMLLGGVAVFFTIKTEESKRKYIESAGIIIIIMSIFIIDDKRAWPGVFALLPTIGAFIVIIANNNKSILSNAAIQYTGKISYSIYLVHWPIIAICYKFGINTSFIWYMFVVIALAFIFHEVIEKRRWNNSKMISIYIITLFLSFQAGKSGLSSRIKTPQYKLSVSEFRHKYEGNMDVKSTENAVYFNSNENDFDFILIGDSFARHYYSFIEKSKKKVVSFAVDGCKATRHFMRPINYSEEIKIICLGRYDKEIEFINNNPGKKVIISMDWLDGSVGDQVRNGNDIKNDIVSELENFHEDIRGSNSDIFIIGNTQGSERVMNECLATLDLALGKYINKCEKYLPLKDMPVHKRLSDFAARHDNVHFIDVTNVLCDDVKCKILDGTMPVYTDTVHLTKKYSNIVGKYIFGKIKDTGR